MHTNEHKKDGSCGCGHDHSHEHKQEGECCGGHGHSHEHKHEGECCGGHGHSHEHKHEGECCGGHGHSHKVNNPDETLALLSYMLDHNRHHAEDLHEIYHSLEANGKTEAAAVLREAMHDYSHANDKLGV